MHPEIRQSRCADYHNPLEAAMEFIECFSSFLYFCSNVHYSYSKVLLSQFQQQYCTWVCGIKVPTSPWTPAVDNRGVRI
jgi:hypothetical protein